MVNNTSKIDSFLYESIRIVWQRTRRPILLVLSLTVATLLLLLLANWKANFIKERTDPIVIVDGVTQTDPGNTSNNEGNNSHESANSIYESELKKTLGIPLKLESGKQSSAQDTILSSGISAVKYQQFRNFNELANALNDAVLRTKERERAFLVVEDKLSSNEKDESLDTKGKSSTDNSKETSIGVSGCPKKLDYDTLNCLDNEYQNISARIYKVRNATDLLKHKEYLTNFLFVDTNPLSVTYNILTYILTGIIVFAIIYVILIPLRYIYFLSPLVGSLTGKSDTFIDGKKKEGAEVSPIFARSVIAAITTIGIGTAAIVTSPFTGAQVNNLVTANNSATAGNIENSTRYDSRGGDTNNYPQAISRESKEVLENLSRDTNKLSIGIDAISSKLVKISPGNNLNVTIDSTGVSNALIDIRDKLQLTESYRSDLRLIINDLTTIKDNIQRPAGPTTNYFGNPSPSLLSGDFEKQLFSRLDQIIPPTEKKPAASEAPVSQTRTTPQCDCEKLLQMLEAFELDRIKFGQNRSEGIKSQNLFSRAKELVASDRYLLTPKLYEKIGKIILRSGFPELVDTPTNAEQIKGIENKIEFVKALKEMVKNDTSEIGKEKELFRSLINGKPAVVEEWKKWKNIVLYYTRIPYK
jgi:hypothetical protein